MCLDGVFKISLLPDFVILTQEGTVDDETHECILDVLPGPSGTCGRPCDLQAHAVEAAQLLAKVFHLLTERQHDQTPQPASVFPHGIGMAVENADCDIAAPVDKRRKARQLDACPVQAHLFRQVTEGPARYPLLLDGVRRHALWLAARILAGMLALEFCEISAGANRLSLCINDAQVHTQMKRQFLMRPVRFGDMHARDLLQHSTK